MYCMYRSRRADNYLLESVEIITEHTQTLYSYYLLLARSSTDRQFGEITKTCTLVDGQTFSVKSLAQTKDRCFIEKMFFSLSVEATV